MDEEKKVSITKLGKQLQTNRLYKIGEILILFISVFVFIKLINPLVGDNPILKQVVVWTANILMLIFVWMGLKLRGESWKVFGLGFKSVTWSEGHKNVSAFFIGFCFGSGRIHSWIYYYGKYYRYS